MKLKLLINKYINRYSQIIKIYNIWWLVITIYWKIRIFIKQQTFNLENPLEKQLAKINSFYEVLNKVEEPNKDGIMFSITKNNNIIELLWNNMEEDYYYIDNIKDDDYNIFEDKVVFWYHLSDYLNPSLKKDEIDKEWEMSYEEFYLLMQIYFWVYKEEELKVKLEEKDKNWKYEDIKKELKWKYWKERLNSNYFEFEKEYLSKPEVQEYLKLELMRKDTSWAFEWIEKRSEKDILNSLKKLKIDLKNINNKIIKEINTNNKNILFYNKDINIKEALTYNYNRLLKSFKDKKEKILLNIELLKEELVENTTNNNLNYINWLEIEKIYDKDWSEEKQRKYIDKINKEFGELIIVKE